MEVVLHKRDADGHITQERILHKVLLARVCGDAPALKKLGCWVSFGAKLGCQFCTLRGIHEEGAIRFLGYARPVPWGLFLPGESRLTGSLAQKKGVALCGAPKTKLTHTHQLSRARIVEGKGMHPSDYGCHGVSPLSKLPYFDMVDGFIVGIGHTGPYGVVKAFWNYVLSGGSSTPELMVSSKSKKLMTARAAHMRATSDCNRPYRDIVDKRGNWTMEDYLHWTESNCTYITRPDDKGRSILPERVA